MSGPVQLLAPTAGRRKPALGVEVRKARPGDVPAMHALINHYAAAQLMLPKTLLQLYENLRDYTVAVDAEGNVVGCGALHIYWQDLAEIRALAVEPGGPRRGIGSRIVSDLIEEGRALGLQRLFVFTYVTDFFARFGFTEVEHRQLPLKVYNECFHCPKFNTCDEKAMVLAL